MAICCFAGHNMSYDETIKQLIYKECIKHIEKNVSEFWVGNYGGYDKAAASIVRKLKKEYPHIHLNLIIHYITKEINESQQYYYNNFNNIIIADIPANTPIRYKIIKTNQYMITIF